MKVVFLLKAITKYSILVLLSCLLVTYAVADTFTECVNKLNDRAYKEGFSDYIRKDIISQLQPIEKVISLDRKQPEFTQSFTRYVDLRVNKYRINKGRSLMLKYKDLLSRLTIKYGIPAHYLVSFWGLETNFGGYKGKISTLNALVSLACDQRRREFFTDELFDLFHLLDDGIIAKSQLQGSWAGAMGHMQFMPSTLRKYGIDGDGDGIIDVWKSIPDALTSAAHYLKESGWVIKETWGREVIVPKQFDFSLIEYDKSYPLTYFKKLGVTKANYSPLPHYEIDAELVLPAGYQGPAFLVYHNYSVILEWNKSRNYALAIAILADRLRRVNSLKHSSAEKNYVFSNDKLKELQQKLLDNKFDVGKPDGVWGPKTRKALRQFQLNNKLIADGFPNLEVFKKMEIK